MLVAQGVIGIGNTMLAVEHAMIDAIDAMIWAAIAMIGTSVAMTDGFDALIWFVKIMRGIG
ncbi:hypothetical protein GCM10022409_38840 [Hymenobacter glaciei]|uniref:Uncharacterized protein n=2 Tax=Hymenobacter glaciei TaxID=877209 RepID=A0ABP7UNU1_9BACT